MIRSRDYLNMDANRKEVPEEGLQRFNLTVNEGDIGRYAGGHIPYHWHEELEIFVLRAGKVTIGIGDTLHEFAPGEGCFINSGVLHSFTAAPDAPCLYRSFVFSRDIAGGVPGSIFDTAYIRPLTEQGIPFLKFTGQTEDSLFFEQFDRAFDACVLEGFGYEFQVREALSHILLQVIAKSPLPEGRVLSPVQENRIKQMLSWLEAHLADAVTVGSLAGSAGICPRECQRLFRRYLHYSPMEYLERLRLYSACRLLAETDLPVTEIALSCGFVSPSYFSKQFKAFTGSQPRLYRTAAAEFKGSGTSSGKKTGSAAF